VVENGLAPYVARGLREAAAAGADAVYLDIDTPGGRIDAAERIADAVGASPVPVYAFVNPRAYSAGALIALSAKGIYMRPGAVLGAATPVDGQGAKASEKMVSAMRAEFRALAEARGLDPRVAEAMVDERVEVPGLDSPEELLTLSTNQALRVGFAKAAVTGEPELLRAIGLPDARVVSIEPNWAELVVRFLTNPLVAPLLLSLGVAYFFIALYHTVELPSIFHYLTLQFLPRWLRGLVLVAIGLAALAIGLWRLSALAVIPLNAKPASDDELVLGYQRASRPPNIAVLSGGPGILILAGLGRHAARLTCITPVQDPVEYYYRASSLFNFENVYYVAPTPTMAHVEVELDDGTRHDIKQNLSHDERLASHHVTGMFLVDAQSQDGVSPVGVTRLTLDALKQADAIIMGPGSLFESILPNLLIPDIRAAM
jgi:ATP-dependent protease ClpP protease subunit